MICGVRGLKYSLITAFDQPKTSNVLSLCKLASIGLVLQDKAGNVMTSKTLFPVGRLQQFGQAEDTRGH